MKTSTITENRELRGWDNHFETGTLAPLRLLQLQRSELGEAARLAAHSHQSRRWPPGLRLGWQICSIHQAASYCRQT